MPKTPHWPWRSPEVIAEQRRRASRQTYCGVYFIGCGEFVKIGMTACLRGRLWYLERDNPQPLTPLGYIPTPPTGRRERELELHQRFAQFRHRREWFRLTPEIKAYIAEHATPWPEGCVAEPT